MNNNCYNIENRSIFNKCLIIVSWLVLAASNAISGVALTINWDPADAQDYGTDYYVDGTLTNAEAQIGKNEAGFYQTLSSYLYHYTSTEYDCCDNNNNAGKTLQVASSDVSLTITLVGYYKMVEWSDRDDYVTSRPFAVAEWDLSLIHI